MAGMIAPITAPPAHSSWNPQARKARTQPSSRCVKGEVATSATMPRPSVRLSDAATPSVEDAGNRVHVDAFFFRAQVVVANRDQHGIERRHQ